MNCRRRSILAQALGIGKFLLPLLAALALVIVLKEAVVPRIVRHRLISMVHDRCGTCELSLGRVRVSLLPPALSGSRTHFTGGEPNATVLDVEAEHVYIPFSLLPLLKGRLRTGRIVIDQPSVTITEGDLYASSSAKDDKARPLDLEIAGIKVNKAAFIYIRNYPGRKARLAVSRINAEAGPVGSSERLRKADAEGSADGLLEESGEFRLKVRAKLLAETPDVDVELQITGQDLSKLNPFLEPTDGIKLKGGVLEGRSSVTIRGAHLNSSAYMRYRGLNVKIKKDKTRGALSAFFQNIMAAVTIGKQNSDGGNYDRRGAAELRRKPKETVISFTMRGMEEAAMKVSAKGGS